MHLEVIQNSMDRTPLAINNITVNVFTKTGLIQLDNGSSCYIYGNILFNQNSSHLVLNASLSGGTAVSVFGTSTLVIHGTASFIRNQALPSTVRNCDVITNGGALFARTESKVIFEESSNVSLIILLKILPCLEVELYLYWTN